MFIRVTYRWGKTFMKVLHSYRKDGKSKQYLIAEFKDYDEEKYIKIKEQLKDWKVMKRAKFVIDEINKINSLSKKGKRYNNIRLSKYF